MSKVGTANGRRGDPKQKERQEAYLRNVSTVEFTKAVTKDVCSPHSGSILALEDPIIPLSDEFEEKIAKLFDDEDAEYKKSSVKHLLIDHFNFIEYDGMDSVINKIYGPSAPNDEIVSKRDFTNFILKYHAPSYYYGQRLRRSAGRGLVTETLELIMRGCDPNTADGEGLNALHYASEFNQIKVVTEVAGICSPHKGLLIVDARCKYGWTPLYCAAHHGNASIVEFLLKLGADPAIRNFVGKTALHAAAAQGRNIICDMIVTECNGRIAQMQQSTKKPSRRSRDNDEEEEEKEDEENLETNDSTESLVTDKTTAARRASVPAVDPQQLIINMQDKHGMTPVHEAAYKGYEKVYNALCKLPHIDLHVRDIMNNLPEDYFKKIAVM